MKLREIKVLNFMWEHAHIQARTHMCIYRVILSVLDPRKCEFLKDYSLDFEHAWTVVANISSISSSIDMLLMKQGM